MNAARAWHVIFVVAAACTCGARTECSEIAQISLLTSLHDDPSCAKPSIKGVMLYEAAGLLAEAHNNRTDYDFDIEITVFDTCDSITGALKAAMKALVWADINCLHPPHYLGIIGPDTATNAEAVHKVTSILKVPHIVKKASISPYLHPLAEESNSYMVQAILKTIEILRWRSFTLVANIDDENDDAQNIAKKLTTSAIARDLCVIVRDNDEEDYTSHIVHIGKPGEKFLRKPANATVLIVDGGDGKDHLNRIHSSNTVLLLEDFRNVIDGLERRVENSRWWTLENDGRGKYDPEKLRQVGWLEDAVEIYTKAAKALCKNKKCKNQISPLDWNHVVSSVLMAHNAESQAAPRFLDLSMKTGDLKRLGGLIVHKGKARVYWGERTNELSLEGDETGANDDTTTANNYEDMPLAFRGLLNRKNEPRSGCVTAKEIAMLDEKDKEAAQIHVLGIDDNEWWTMVCMVSSIGVAMFVVGILAVYVIYKNIQNPRCPKGKDQLGRDTSLRRMGSDREPPTTITSRNQRALRMPSRMGSNRSNVSEKSV